MTSLKRQNYLILDGPTGTELVARGYRPDASSKDGRESPLWTARAAIEAPERLKAVHLDYLRAGANILTANTFRTSSYTAAKAGLSVADARQLTHTSVAVATDAIEEVDGDGKSGVPRFLAGSLAPLEDCYQPRLTPELAVLERGHAETASWLVEAGCDLILAETMGTGKEALVAVKAARAAGIDSVLVSFILDASGKRLLGGDSLVSAARTCVEAGADGILINCVHGEVVTTALPLLRELWENGVVLGAYANAARMRLDYGGGVRWDPDARPLEELVREYAVRAAEWGRLGARIIGSCCGTGPAHIAALRETLPVAR